MHESLGAARLIHQLLVVVSGAMLAFAITAERPRNEFAAALAEAERLDRMVGDMPNILSHDLTAYYRRSGVVDILKRHFTSTASFMIVPDWYDLDSRFDQSTRGAWRLSELERYLVTLARRDGATAWRLDHQSLHEALSTDAAQRRKNTFIELVQFSQRPQDSPGEVVLRIRPNHGSDLVLRVRQHAATPISLSALHSALQDDGLALVGPKQLYDVLPELKGVWDTVGSAELGTALAMLRHKSAEFSQSNEKELEILGLKISSRVASAVGPTVLLLLLLYFLAHVTHLRVLMRANGAEASHFPWIALFDDSISVWLTRASVFVLPAAASAALIWVSELAFSARVTTAVAVVCVVESIAVLIFARLRHVNAMMRVHRMTA